MLKKETKDFITHCHDRGLLVSQIKQQNEQLKQFLDEWKYVRYTPTASLKGKNSETRPIILEANHMRHIIPANCTYFNVDVMQIDSSADCTEVGMNAYDLIVIDPPWWNKYVRRCRKFHRFNGYGKMLFQKPKYIFSYVYVINKTN